MKLLTAHVISAFLALCATCTSGRAALPRRDVMLAAPSFNGDYLNHVKAPPKEKNLPDTLFDKALRNEVAARYNSFQMEYELKRNHGLIDLGDQLRYSSANKGLVDWTLHQMLDNKVRAPLRRWAWRSTRGFLRSRAASDRAQPSSPTLAPIPTTAAATHAGSAAGNESDEFFLFDIYRELEFFYNNGVKIDETALMRFQYDMPAGTMNLSLIGSIIDSSLEYYVLPLELTSSGLGNTPANADRVSFSLGKNLSELGLSTGISYKLGTRILNYGMSKSIVGPVSAAVQQVRHTMTPGKNETTYRLDMGLAF